MLKIVVAGLYMVITCIFFLRFVLNFVVIYSTPKIVNVLFDDNIVNLSYIIIVSFCAYIFIFYFSWINKRSTI